MNRGYLDFIHYVNKLKLGLLFKDEELKKYNTFKIGGKCYCLYKPDNVDNFKKAYRYILLNKLDYFVIGNGSNLLITEEYQFRIYICLKGLNQISLNEDTIEVSSGVMGNILSKKLSLLNYSGLEFLAGIPGTIGGMIYMNAGSNNKSISDVLESITYIDELGKICTMNNIKDKGFSYRSTPFMKRKVIILSCIIKLTKDENANKLYLECLNNKMNSQPLSEHSAGCIFKNPFGYKSWQLIKDSVKVKSINDAVISDKHANFLINKNHATFNDMKNLINRIKEEVYNKYNILLETEITIVE